MATTYRLTALGAIAAPDGAWGLFFVAMSATLIALFGSAIFELQQAEPDRATLEHSLSLLARCAEGEPQSFEMVRGLLHVNGRTISLVAPGAAIVADALVDHDTAALKLPGGLEPRHWREVAEVYAAPFAHFPTAIDVLGALRISLPGTDVTAHGRPSRGTPGEVKSSQPTAATPKPSELTSRGGDLGTFSGEAARLQIQGSDAVARRDATGVAEVLLALEALHGGTPSLMAIAAKECQRILPPASMSWLVGEAASLGSHQVGDALVTLGGMAVEPILAGMGRSSSPAQRGVLFAVISRIPELKPLVVSALQTDDQTMLRGAADVAGRMHLTAAIAPLSLLLRHSNAEVRTAAWRALESIGTREAIDALNTPIRA